MKKILQLSTYPIYNPLHGGQIRVSQIRKFFEKKGCKVKSLSLSESSHESYTDDDYLLNDYELQKLVQIPFCTDYATSLICTKGKYYQFLKNKILDFNPDIILVEQAWLYPVIKKLRLKNILSSNVLIVYSSHNIEYKTKKLLLNSHNFSDKKIHNIINSIYLLEKELCINSDVVITCTSTDSTEFVTMGAKKTIVAHNGVSVRKTNDTQIQNIKNILQSRKYILFVGSAYPPNGQGFWKMLGDSMAFLPPDTIILVAGGISKIIENYMPENAKLYSYVSMDRIKRLGFVSEELLGVLVQNADIIILPITIGGGSNLKTAEAIASGRPVVATETACRGFNFIHKLSNFKVANNKKEFINEIMNFLTNTHDIIFSEQEKKERQSVFWENCLEPIKILLNN